MLNHLLYIAFIMERVRFHFVVREFVTAFGQQLRVRGAQHGRAAPLQQGTSSYYGHHVHGKGRAGGMPPNVHLAFRCRPSLSTDGERASPGPSICFIALLATPCLQIVGSLPELGGWDAVVAPQMTWLEGHRWKLDTVLPKQPFQFKVECHHQGRMS